MTKVELQEKIAKLEKGIKSPTTPASYLPELKAKKEQYEKELKELEAKKEEPKKEEPKKAAKPAKSATSAKEKLKEKLKKVAAKKAEPKKKAEPAKKAEPKKKATKPAAKPAVSALGKLKSKRKAVAKPATGGAKKAKELLSKLDKKARDFNKGRSAAAILRDAENKGKKAGKRKSASGATYYEYRPNRVDMNVRKKPYLEQGGYMADGGELEKKINHINNTYDGVVASKTYSSNRIQVVSPYFNTLSEIKKKEFDNSGLMERYGNTSQYILYSNKAYMADGGMMDEGVDLFDDYDNIPEEVMAILEKYNEEGDGGSYEVMGQMKDELEGIGYTFDFDLSGSPYDLRKIGQKGKYGMDEFARGGYNYGRSWSADRARFNKKERWEVPMGQRKLAFGGDVGKGYAHGGKLSLKKFKEMYDDNEDRNLHSENVVLLAENFGTDQDIRDAKTILAKHEAIGSLPHYLMQERDALAEKLWAKYLKASKADGGYMADGGETDQSFKYMMLSRLESDVEYYLGYGNRNPKVLWAGNVDDQIAEMKKIWEELSVKPEWLSMEDILQYEREMKGTNMARGGYNYGRSWSADRARFNKNEDWEIPMWKRMFAEGGEMGKNMNVFGYETKHFDVCPIAVKEFEAAIAQLNEKATSEAEKEDLAKTAEYVDKVFAIEKGASNEGYEEAVNHLMTASMYNYRSGMLVNLFSFMPMHLDRIHEAKHGLKKKLANGGDVDDCECDEYADGGDLSEGFSIKEMKEKLNRMFPDSLGFSVGNISNEGDKFKNAAALLVDSNDPYKGLEDSDIKSRLFFPKYKRDHDIRFRIYQGGENTYFYFILESENGDQYIGQFGFKDRGDVPSDYITRFIAFLMQQYGLPFQVNHNVMANGGDVDDCGCDEYAEGGKLNKYKIFTDDSRFADDLLKYADLQNISASQRKFGSKYVVTFDAIPEIMDSMTDGIKRLILGLSNYKMAEGGELNIEAENKDMLLNYAEELEHHVKEFEVAAKDAEKVMPWVVAKIERASTDLSDVTHYLSSENARRSEETTGEESQYAEGGQIRWQDADYGDSALVIAENKLGLILKPYGRKFHLKFIDGTEKTYDATELRFYKDIEDDYAEGGEVKEYNAMYFRQVNTRDGSKMDSMRERLVFSGSLDSVLAKAMANFSPLDAYVTVTERPSGSVVAKMTKDGKAALYDKSGKETGKVEVEIDVEKSDDKPKKKLFGLFKDGGLTGDVHSLTDELLSQKIQIFIDKVQPIKYYYIDDKTNSLIVGFDENFTQGSADRFHKAATSSREFFDADSVDMKYISETGDTQYIIKLNKKVIFAKGGKLKFTDKVKSIKSSLLKRKKVSPKVQKDYGKTYSPKEAEESAKRIVGAMTAKERLLSKMKKRK